MIKKILIANRGEIALRIVKACREMGIVTVAIYSEVDRNALHVQAADEAVEIGAGPPLESYLNIPKIISAAKATKCDAIHPGYGFLAENHRFVKQCEEHGIIFIGPNSKAMKLLGDKLRARKKMANAGIPILPGMQSKKTAKQTWEEVAEAIGFPVMIKASAGGGGKGMRIIHKKSDLYSAIQSGSREAKTAFGDDTIYLEKYIEKPRHVEFQVLVDLYGNNVHLFERECSIQRRHQKIVEETPCTALSENLRKEMGETACKVITLSGYTNAGTVEFLLDQNNNYYFLEVNARIQVEHPVTELVTGIDLVKQQIRIASGEKLDLTQEQIRQRGHAIECRIYAEDPENHFYPSFGKLLLVKEPSGAGIRCDSGIFSGLEIPYFYDPILSKLIVWENTRLGAIRRMIAALSEYVILGVKTQIPFLQAIMAHPEFQAGNTHTHFISEYFGDWRPVKNEQNLKIALLGAALKKLTPMGGRKPAEVQRIPTPWETIGKWELLSN
jgi:acetyl-CoA carboxylase biotin carboxylase subunit